MKYLYLLILVFVFTGCNTVRYMNKPTLTDVWNDAPPKHFATVYYDSTHGSTIIGYAPQGSKTFKTGVKKKEAYSVFYKKRYPFRDVLVITISKLTQKKATRKEMKEMPDKLAEYFGDLGFKRLVVCVSVGSENYVLYDSEMRKPTEKL